MKDAYDAQRKAGTNAVQSAGDAYNPVDMDPLEEEAEEQASGMAGKATDDHR